MIERSVRQGAGSRAQESGQAWPARERGTCSGCGTATKTLTAPKANVGHGYSGPMYCLPCTPRFSGDGLAIIERLGG